MIKLDPEEEADEDDEDKPLNKLNPKQVAMQSSGINQNANFNYQQVTNASNVSDGTLNNIHINNVQINLTRVDLPPEYQNFVSSFQY